ncbi:hypothetical protein F2Q69_00005541 [Brassica cretica]|uniref:Uncharacterized protein n=1 Tax=Brassica cretica TaxID=69181 RepID=A0A8S9NTN0_BRACR|nr:hypothetical protein F2Q69_00005541 [Brassica cretica]
MVTAVAEKKPGLPKSLFSVAGGNNSKFVQVLMSPRKRAPAKQSLRKGGGPKSSIRCGLLVSWNVRNKVVRFSFWIWSMLLMRSGLKGRVRMSDAVSSMQLDVSGRQAKDLAHVWFVGIGMWLKTERNVLVAWTQALWLVSLN